MNRGQFKDPVSHMCLAGAMVASWPLLQEMAGSSPLYCNDKYIYCLGQGNVFTGVLSVHRGIGFPACITGHTTKGVCIQGVCLQGGLQGGLPSGGLPPGGVCIGVGGVCNSIGIKRAAPSMVPNLRINAKR